ncbi:MAG: hypothetical protein JRN44_01125 [Nitrososphaerota archaeon]|jgi:hypothetical protein|nr:hypothetical protein [Nitrososphaerota archaeon]MDG6941718.1 hypothetical protein [Nitrososphaerota archaeon]MDG6947108.1 hypothetical protein [Nitrososphaerota archaeon]MDG6951342.1 hypothetical protein [Nitrososphaerota archaeon]
MRPKGTFDDATEEEIGEISSLFPGLTCKTCGSTSISVSKWWTLEGKPMGSPPTSAITHVFLWECDECDTTFRKTATEKRQAA